MTKKALILLLLAAALGGVYAYYFTDWINTPRIQILKSNRPIGRMPDDVDVLPVAFMLDGKYELTSVKVVDVAAAAADRKTTPMWELVTASNSPPVKGFYYGQRLQGLKPPKKDLRPQRLKPNVTYRLSITAGRSKGELDFQAQSSDLGGG